MLTSFSMTIPTITDKYRTLGRRFINTPSDNVSHSNLLTGRSDADNIHHYWHKQAIQNVYDGLQANKTSQHHYLSDRIKPVRGTNATNTPFGSSNAPSNVVAGGRGGANITQSSSMSDKDYDDWRKFVINQRAEGYNAIRTAQPMPQPIPPKMQSIMTDPNKAIENQLDLLLTSIEERVFSGIIDNNVYKDLNDYARGIEGIIYSFDDAQEITDIINRLENIADSAEVVASRRGTAMKQKEANFAESVIATINRLSDFLRANMTTVGRNESTRKLMQQASREYLTNVGERIERIPTVGVLTPEEVQTKINTKEWTLTKLRALPNEDLVRVAGNIGIVLRKPPAQYVDFRKRLGNMIKEKLTPLGLK